MYEVNESGVLHHKCKGTSMWNEIYVNRKGLFEFSVMVGDAVIDIKYCPFCGEELKNPLITHR